MLVFWSGKNRLFCGHRPALRYIFAFLKKKSKGCRCDQGYKLRNYLFANMDKKIRFLLNQLKTQAVIALGTKKKKE
jgi:hypothetical protein